MKKLLILLCLFTMPAFAESERDLTREEASVLTKAACASFAKEYKNVIPVDSKFCSKVSVFKILEEDGEVFLKGTLHYSALGYKQCYIKVLNYSSTTTVDCDDYEN